METAKRRPLSLAVPVLSNSHTSTNSPTGLRVVKCRERERPISLQTRLYPSVFNLYRTFILYGSILHRFCLVSSERVQPYKLLFSDVIDILNLTDMYHRCIRD